MLMLTSQLQDCQVLPVLWLQPLTRPAIFTHTITAAEEALTPVACRKGHIRPCSRRQGRHRRGRGRESQAGPGPGAGAHVIQAAARVCSRWHLDWVQQKRV